MLKTKPQAAPPADISPSDVLTRLAGPFRAYKAAASADPTADAGGWELQVFTEGEGKFGHTVVLIPEVHESANAAVHRAAADLADAILALPKVSIGVEEPVRTAHNQLIPNVAADVSARKKVIDGTEKLFKAEPNTKGSVAYQLYVKQVEENRGGVRFIAEPAIDRPRAHPDVNPDMAKNLAAFGPLVVYPVGAYHLVERTVQFPKQPRQTVKSLGDVFIAKGFKRVRK
jgi:hypothetical protein